MNNKVKFTGIPLENYSSYYSIDKNKSVKCYSAKQMKALYPNKNFKIVGEYPPKKESIAEIEINDITFPIGEYGKQNQLVYSSKGYIQCVGENNTFIVLKKNSLLSRIFIVVALLAAVLIGIYSINNLNSSDIKKTSILELDPNAVDNDPNSQVNTSKSGIQLPGFKVLNIISDTKEVQVNFNNPQGNPCYFVVSLNLDDGTELYKSKMIPPGKGIYNITLEKTLSKGEYNAVLKYDTFGVEGLAPMNGADVKLTLVAK
jgi:hypothetical protein